ncbi:hypothetical protein EBR78_06165 [bacterium]|nr:hypothetical protein [bacterium]NBX82421.1 hypothetical protein [bacterium]
MFLKIGQWVTAAVIFTSGFVWGAGNRLPILVKSNSPGYVLPDFSFGEKCSLYADRVEIEYRMSESIVKEVRSLKGAKSLELLVSRAATDKLRYEDNLLCDGPSTEVVGYSRNTTNKVVVYSTGGCGTPKAIREGGAAYQLMRLIENYCAKTH